MPDFTIRLVEMEERDRKQRRRTKLLAAAAVIAFLAAMRRPEPKIPEPEIRVVTIPVHHFLWERIPVATPVIVPILPPRTFRMMPVQWPQMNVAIDRPERHLCVTPKRLGLGLATGDRLTVSNVGNAPIKITQIGTVPPRNGFTVDATDCENKRLQAGERCTISIAVRETRSETMYVLIANDTGEAETIRVEAPTASPASRVPVS